MNYQNMMIVRLLFFLAATTHALSEAPCIERERHALLRFKEGITFDGDNFLESWTSSRKDCCAWRGIRCDNLTYHILVIDLHPNFTYDDDRSYSWYPLAGEISSSIVELQHLRLLNLSYNDFTTIPKFIGALKSLTFLDLAENSLAGTIPSELGNLTNLRFLGLGGAFGGLTANNLEWISHLPNLKIFRLSDANLTNSLDWFQSIKTAPSLSSLELTSCDFPVQVDISSLYHINSSNSLTTLDVSSGTMYPTTVPSLLNLSNNLVSLAIQWGRIGGPLPDSFGDMNSLRHIILPGNEFEGPIPKSIGNHCNLQHLDLSHNSFDGTLHEFLENRAASCLEDSLETLDMRGNKLSGSFSTAEIIPTSLRKLLISYNRLTGQVPDLSNMSSLREFDISHNKLNGSLPESIGQLHNLEILHLSSNSLSGIVSEVHFQKLSNLKELALTSNSLTLSFNSNWVPPFQLSFLSLSSCNLGPQFPSWLHNQLNLSHLDISNSGISGAIPDWFSKQSLKLEYLDLSSNLLNSTLPNFPLMSDNYPIINFSCNQFHGFVPPSLSNASELYLSNNNINGLRSFLCNQKDGETTVLDLSNNLLSGRLPNCRCNFKSLVVLILENNELSGMIPGSITSLHRLANLNLRNNSFSGRLPSQLKHCTDLQVLDVGENNLIGEIPSWIGEILDQLVLLSLKSNRFYGTIPSTICKLQFLQIVDLSINNISGAIPSCIDNFTSMVQYKDRGGDTRYPQPISILLPKKSNLYLFYTTAYITWKGIEYKYKEILGLLRVIDLSSNRLTGEIPKQLENLSELVQLNLSRNNLSGAIPTKIGKLSKLESLDLSHNDLSGRIPVSLAQISTLDYLDLSNNQLSGRIPTSTQLQSFNASAYIGNLQLCGQPLTPTCPGDETSEVPLNSDESYDDDDNGEWYDMSWLRMGIGVGFAVGFCGVCGNLWLITTFRLAYFQFMDNMGDWLYVLIVVKWAMLKRRFSS